MDKVMSILNKLNDSIQHSIAGLVILHIMLFFSDTTAAFITVCMVAGAKEFGDLDNWEAWAGENFKDFIYTTIPSYIAALSWEIYHVI